MNEMHNSQFSTNKISCFFKKVFIVYLSWNTFSDFVTGFCAVEQSDRDRATATGIGGLFGAK